MGWWNVLSQLMTKNLIATVAAASDDSVREVAVEIEGVGDPTPVLGAWGAGAATPEARRQRGRCGVAVR